MKDAVSTWGKLWGRTYSAVNTNPNCTTKRTDDCPRSSPRNVALDLLFNGKFRSILTIAFLGLLTLAIGAFILIIQPYDILFKLKCIFSEGGEIFEMWRKPPVDLYLRVFLFNVTNKEAFLNGEEKLRVEEVGPYVYRELMAHEDVKFNENGTISAIPSHPLVWVPELSEGHREDDQLVLPHIALLSIAQVVSTASFVTRFGLNVIIRQTESEPLIQMSAREFMFGYESELMSLGYKFLTDWISFDKLGLIDRMYDFEGDFETVYTGENDLKITGLLDTYRGSKNLPQWKGRCGNINQASDGTKFAGFMKQNETLLFFRKSMCRAHTLVPANKTTVSGLDGIIYEFEQNANDNGKYRPENSCFCSEERCLPAGLLDVKGCYYGFPIATSYPHFLDADPSVRDYVDGTSPDPDKHKSYFVVQPESGLPLEVAARFQINMVFGDLSAMVNVEQFSGMVLPLLWTESRLYNLPSDLQMRFNLYINVLPGVQTAAIYVAFVLGTIIIAVAARKYFQKIKALGKAYHSTWIDEYVEEDVNRKLSLYSFSPPTKRESLTSKELQVYFNSLITPLNQEISFEEFQELKEEIV